MCKTFSAGGKIDLKLTIKSLSLLPSTTAEKMKLSGLLILSYKEHPCRPARMFLIVSPKNNFPNTSTPAVCPTRTSSSAPPPTTNGYPALCCGKSPIPSFTLPTPSSLTSPLKNWTKPSPGGRNKRIIWGSK